MALWIYIMKESMRGQCRRGDLWVWDHFLLCYHKRAVETQQSNIRASPHHTFDCKQSQLAWLDGAPTTGRVSKHWTQAKVALLQQVFTQLKVKSKHPRDNSSVFWELKISLVHYHGGILALHLSDMELNWSACLTSCCSTSAGFISRLWFSTSKRLKWLSLKVFEIINVLFLCF